MNNDAKELVANNFLNLRRVSTVLRSSLYTSISKLAKQRLSNIRERYGLINLRILNGSGFEIAIMGSPPQKHPPPLWERRLRRDFEAESVKQQ